ncbi:MAG: hypothetical protein JNM94_15100 [Phycisphaerae bacterium]|nr:hypothetical protein [Phycisphaerae bacterium]
MQLDILNVVALGGASGGGASTAGQPGTIGFFSDRFGDANGDCMVDGADLAILLGSWGSCEGCPVDLNDDGVVDGADLAILLGAWKR